MNRFEEFWFIAICTVCVVCVYMDVFVWRVAE
jgi:hypothetical protein